MRARVRFRQLLFPSHSRAHSPWRSIATKHVWQEEHAPQGDGVSVYLKRKWWRMQGARSACVCVCMRMRACVCVCACVHAWACYLVSDWGYYYAAEQSSCWCHVMVMARGRYCYASCWGCQPSRCATPTRYHQNARSRLRTHQQPARTTHARAQFTLCVVEYIQGVDGVGGG